MPTEITRRQFIQLGGAVAVAVAVPVLEITPPTPNSPLGPEAAPLGDELGPLRKVGPELKLPDDLPFSFQRTISAHRLAQADGSWHAIVASRKDSSWDFQQTGHLGLPVGSTRAVFLLDYGDRTDDPKQFETLGLLDPNSESSTFERWRKSRGIAQLQSITHSQPISIDNRSLVFSEQVDGVSKDGRHYRYTRLVEVTKDQQGALAQREVLDIGVSNPDIRQEKDMQAVRLQDGRVMLVMPISSTDAEGEINNFVYAITKDPETGDYKKELLGYDDGGFASFLNFKVTYGAEGVPYIVSIRHTKASEVSLDKEIANQWSRNRPDDIPHFSIHRVTNDGRLSGAAGLKSPYDPLLEDLDMAKMLRVYTGEEVVLQSRPGEWMTVGGVGGRFTTRSLYGEPARSLAVQRQRGLGDVAEYLSWYKMGLPDHFQGVRGSAVLPSGTALLDYYVPGIGVAWPDPSGSLQLDNMAGVCFGDVNPLNGSVTVFNVDPNTVRDQFPKPLSVAVYQ